MSDALMATYKLVWDDFCSWYLEMVKPEFGHPVDPYTYEATIGFFETILKVVHPFMPFISEEIWHLLRDRKQKDCIIIASWPKTESQDAELIEMFEAFAATAAAVRNVRNEKNISPKEPLSLFRKKAAAEGSFPFDELLKKLVNLDKISIAEVKQEHSVSFMTGSTEYFIPLSAKINMKEEREKLLKDLDYNLGFLKSVQHKLSNERFVNNAKPEIIATERKKEADATARINSIREQLESMK
jgi:valyl-tRNA synthetase